MEYRRSYRNEQPDGYLIDRHEREIFPLMKRRYLFSGSAMFRIYDLFCDGGSVNENVFAYSNRAWARGHEEKALIFFNNSYYETAGWIRMSDPAVPYEGGTRRDSLSEALAIHGEGHYFTLLREQKSCLWYIRSSKAISEEGFFVGLKGYETQVYLDIHEVEDDAKGRWARLNNDLAGAGVPDPLASIKDIFLGELYYRFNEFFKPEVIDHLCNMSGKQTNTGMLKKLAEDFIKTASHFISGANGAYDPWTASGTELADKDNVSFKFTEISRAVILKEFDSFIIRMEKIKAALKSTQAPFFKNIKNRITNEHLLFAVVLGYGVLSILRSAIGKEANGRHASHLAFNHWDLGRKLREIFSRFDVFDHEAWLITDLARVVLSKMKTEPFDKKNEKFNAVEFALFIFEENYLDEDFRRILGINLYDDVAWFNKEGFENALFYSSLFFLAESSLEIPFDERLDRIIKVYDVLSKAKKKSGYRLDVLIESLTIKPAKDGKQIKTSAKTKTKEKTGEKAKVKKSEKSKPKPAAKTKPNPSVKTKVKTSNVKTKQPAKQKAKTNVNPKKTKGKKK
jgi:predicted transcriptional regulator